MNDVSAVLHRPDNLWYRENMKKKTANSDGQGLDPALNKLPLALPFASFASADFDSTTGKGYDIRDTATS